MGTIIIRQLITSTSDDIIFLLTMSHLAKLGVQQLL